MIRAAMAALLVLLTAGCKPQSPLLFEGGPRFSALIDGTVRDNRFQLIWAKSANIPSITGSFEGLTWPEALQFVAEMNARGWTNMDHRDWRLPRVEELVALMTAFWPQGSGAACMAEGFDGPCRFHVPYAPFTDVIETCYWSGTTKIGNSWQDGRGLYVASAMASVPDHDAAAVWAIDRDAHPFPLSSMARCGVWPVRGNDR